MSKAALVLRAASSADLDAIMAIERFPGYEASVGRSTRSEHEAMFAGPWHAYFVGEREGVDAFAILRDLDDLHGNVYLKRIAARPGRGAGRGLLALLLDWTFAHTPAHRFYLDCFDDNVRAQAMYEKLGFSRDGVLREAYLGPDGRRRDLLLMALTRPEWATQRGRSSTMSAP
jgi:RimJ/RimL family protein N-acetyltransferase